MMRAPDAPTGWPSAQPPPWMFMMSWLMPRSRITAIGTTANASFTSNRSTSDTFQPTRSSTFFTAPTGAVVNHSGSWAKVA